MVSASGRALPPCWPLLPPWAKTKGAPLFLGSPDPLPSAESSNHFIVILKLINSEVTGKRTKASGGPRWAYTALPQLAVCVWLRVILAVSLMRGLGRKHRGDHAPRTGVLWQRQDFHWKPQGMKWHKNFLQTTSEEGKLAFPICRGPRPHKITSGKVNLYPVF